MLMYDNALSQSIWIDSEVRKDHYGHSDRPTGHSISPRDFHMEPKH